VRRGSRLLSRRQSSLLKGKTNVPNTRKNKCLMRIKKTTTNSYTRSYREHRLWSDSDHTGLSQRASMSRERGDLKSEQGSRDHVLGTQSPAGKPLLRLRPNIFKNNRQSGFEKSAIEDGEKRRSVQKTSTGVQGEHDGRTSCVKGCEKSFTVQAQGVAIPRKERVR